MVTQYGMSSLGRVNYREDRSNPFLTGSTDLTSRQYSEQTAREIDEEVNRIITHALEQVRKILEIRHDVLVALTNRLVEVEAVDGDELKKIVDEHTRQPFVVPGTDARTGTVPSADSDGKESTKEGPEGPG